jgi:cyclopropane-fatty-acyl-phospholipid synthase
MKTEKLKSFFEEKLKEFPYKIEVVDWEGNKYSIGKNTKKHWRGGVLKIIFKNDDGAKKFIGLDALGFIESFLKGDVDLEDNIYLIRYLSECTRFDITLLQKIPRLIINKAFQNVSRARVNVRSHYDIDQRALDLYLDHEYLAYACAMFKDSLKFNKKELLKIGNGKIDDFDSLEMAQWRRFKDAVDFCNPKRGESLLDIGCGYGGQLKVSLENYPNSKIVGWTHSKNQVKKGREMLKKFDSLKWEINEGDYREEKRVFDHVMSTGMACHVGPNGLVPYIKNVRARIKKDGRYLHHVLMTPYSRLPFDFNVGVAFNKKYVWPGFHWFTLGEHIKALEENGFEVIRVVNLSEHYRKTTAAWYERMIANKDKFIEYAGDKTFRAWQLYLASGSETFAIHRGYVYRVYCRAL